MTSRIFFYGLYMDTRLLASMGFHPEQVGLSKLADYEILIGERASLAPALGRTAYGVLLDLPKSEAAALYSRPEVEDYRSKTVEVTLLSDNAQHGALCYLLPKENLGASTNSAYVQKLQALAKKLGFPASYIRDITRCGYGT